MRTLVPHTTKFMGYVKESNRLAAIHGRRTCRQRCQRYRESLPVVTITVFKSQQAPHYGAESVADLKEHLFQP